MHLYLEVNADWVAEARGIPRRERDRLVEPGHVRIFTADDDPATSPIPRLVDKVAQRFGVMIWDRLRKTPPDTPELGWYDADTQTMTWN